MSLFFNDDILLKLVCHLNLSSAWALSQTCSSAYRLSLSSLSFWIYTTDVDRLPVPLSKIRDSYSAGQVRYMAKTMSFFERKLREEGEAADLEHVSEHPYPLLRDWINYSTSALVQGYTQDSLLWLVSVREGTIYCDCLDPGYHRVAVGWGAGATIDMFWGCRITNRPSTDSTPLEKILITFATTDEPLSHTWDYNRLGVTQLKSLYVVEIDIPTKNVLDLAREYRLKTNRRLYPPPEVSHVSCVPIPQGFESQTCLPNFLDSNVYFVLERRNPESGVIECWAFVYDWEANAGVAFKVPKRISCVSAQGLSRNVMVLRDRRDSIFTICVPELSPISGSSSPDGSTTSQWRFHEGPLTVYPVRLRFGRRPTDTTGTVCRVSETEFFTISGHQRFYCHHYRSSNGNAEFALVAEGSVEPVELQEDFHGVNTSCYTSKVGGSRVLVVKTVKDDLYYAVSKKTVELFIVDFDLDYGYCGEEGVKMIHGTSREFEMERVDSSRVTGQVLRNGFDGFRGTIAFWGQYPCQKIEMFSCT